MKALQFIPLLILIASFVGCGNDSAPTPTTSVIALPTAAEQDVATAASREPKVTSSEVEAAIESEIELAEPEPTSTQPPEPTVASSPPTDIASDGRLVIIDPANQILTINPDGSDMRRLSDVADGIIYIFPAWSPDGQSIAVIGAGDRPATDGVYMFEDSADVPANRIFTADGQQPIYLSWSPDSENVSFIAPRLGGSTLLDLRVVQRDGSERSRYLAFGQPFYWDWDSTGDEIVINTNRTTHAKFAYVNADGSGISEDIATVTDAFQSPDLSHDDAYIAYSGSLNGINEIVIEDRATGETIRTAHEGLTAFSWSPVTNQLAYINSVGRTPLPYGPLHLFDATGADSTIVADAVIAFFWSPDGSKIAYLTLSPQGDDPEAQRGRLSSKSAEPFFQSNLLEYQLWVADVATTQAKLLGSFRPGNLFISQFLPFFDQYAHSHSIWSPDSTALVIPIQTEDGVTIYRFPANGAQPAPVSRGRVAFWTRN